MIKPTSLCLVEMGKNGLELVRSYPEVLSSGELNEIIIKSMPMGSKDGDFTTSSAGPNYISGYIFAIPSEERTNIASLVAVFNDENYEHQVIKKVFTFTVDELRKNELMDKETLSNILNKLYDGLVKGKLSINIRSETTLNFEIKTGSSDDEKEKDSLDEFGEDVWK
jgi:hypothetical protein